MTPAWLNEVRLDATLPRVLSYKAEIRDALEEVPQNDPKARDIAALSLAARYPQIEALAILLRAPETLEDRSILDELEDLLELARSPGIQPILKKHFPPEELSPNVQDDNTPYRQKVVEPSEIREPAVVYDLSVTDFEERSDREVALLLDIEVRRDRGEIAAQARSLEKLARLNFEEGRRKEAEASLREAVALWRQDEDLKRLTAALINLASILWDALDWEAAEALLMEAIELLAELDDLSSETMLRALRDLGAIQWKLGKLEEAQAHLSQAVQLATNFSDTNALANVWHHYALVLRDLGQPSTARECIDKALALLEEQILQNSGGEENDLGRAALLHSLAIIFKSQGDIQGASETLQRVLKIERKVYGKDDHLTVASTEKALGLLLLPQPETSLEGAKLLRHALHVFQIQLGEDHPETQELARLFSIPQARLENEST